MLVRIEGKVGVREAVINLQLAGACMSGAGKGRVPGQCLLED